MEGPGRPQSTTHAAVSAVALELFATRGFEQTTMEDIAAAVGVSRRTLFRYYASKNDMVWGDFDAVLDRLRGHLDEAPPEAPLVAALGRAVVLSNRYPPEGLEGLRVRMTLVTTVPALQAHSMLRYTAWRRVVAEWAAHRLGLRPDDLLPETIAQVALGTAMSAYVCWVHGRGGLEDNLVEGFRHLATGFATPG
jgi:TetR/AcrR family transcriptional regulator, regulator of mycofactocin system